MLSLLALDAALDAFEGVSLDVIRAKLLGWAGSSSPAPIRCWPGWALRHHPRAPERRGSHVTLRHPGAQPLMAALIEAGVIGDVRPPDLLRFGFKRGRPRTPTSSRGWRGCAT